MRFWDDEGEGSIGTPSPGRQLPAAVPLPSYRAAWTSGVSRATNFLAPAQRGFSALLGRQVERSQRSFACGCAASIRTEPQFSEDPASPLLATSVPRSSHGSKDTRANSGSPRLQSVAERFCGLQNSQNTRASAKSASGSSRSSVERRPPPSGAAPGARCAALRMKRLSLHGPTPRHVIMSEDGGRDCGRESARHDGSRASGERRASFRHMQPRQRATARPALAPATGSVFERVSTLSQRFTNAGVWASPHDRAVSLDVDAVERISRPSQQRGSDGSGEEDTGDGCDGEPGDGELSASAVISYSSLKAAMSFSDISVNLCGLVYTEAYGLPMGTLSVVTTLAKCFDFLVGFAIGFASDNTKTRWGRRKPYIAVGGPVSAICLMLLIFPPSSLVAHPSAVHAPGEELRPCAEATGNCSTVVQCVSGLIGQGKLPEWTQPTGASKAPGSGSVAPTEASPWLGIWFFITFGLRFCGGHTVANIPYDALGMELTSDYHGRAQLLGIKNLFGLGGLLCAILSSVAISLAWAPPLATQVSVLVTGGAILTALAAFALLCCVHEQPDAEVEAAAQFVPSIRDLLRNAPYVNYLLVKVFLTFASQLPKVIFMFYIKYFLREEDSLRVFNYGMIELIGLSIVLMQPVVGAMSRFGKKETLIMVLLLQGSVFTLASLVPGEMASEYGLIYAIIPFWSLGHVCSLVVPEAMLADIIDYDELHTGTRRSGVYVVLETNIMQMLEIVGQMGPLLLLSANGYRNNGGCECGCGIKCAEAFQRWSCPADVGYACSAALSPRNALFFGDPGRDAPCTSQPAGVELVICSFFFVVPAVCYVCCAVPAWFAPIDADKQAAIVEQSERRRVGFDAHDPLTGAPLPPYPTDDERAEMNALLHFDEDELELFELRGFGVAVGVVVLRLCVWVLLGVACVFVVYRTHGTAHFDTAMSAGSIVLTVLLCLILWEALRIHSFREHEAELAEYREAVNAFALVDDPERLLEGSISGRLKGAFDTVAEATATIAGRIRGASQEANATALALRPKGVVVPPFLPSMSSLAPSFESTGSNSTCKAISLGSRKASLAASDTVLPLVLGSLAPVSLEHASQTVRANTALNVLQGQGVLHGLLDGDGATVQEQPRKLSSGAPSAILRARLQSGQSFGPCLSRSTSRTSPAVSFAEASSGRATCTSRSRKPSVLAEARRHFSTSLMSERKRHRHVPAKAAKLLGLDATQPADVPMSPEPKLVPTQGSTSASTSEISEDRECEENFGRQIAHLQARLGVSAEKARALAHSHAARDRTAISKAPFRQDQQLRKLMRTFGGTEGGMSAASAKNLLAAAEASVTQASEKTELSLVAQRRRQRPARPHNDSSLDAYASRKDHSGPDMLVSPPVIGAVDVRGADGLELSA